MPVDDQVPEKCWPHMASSRVSIVGRPLWSILAPRGGHTTSWSPVPPSLEIDYRSEDRREPVLIVSSKAHSVRSVEDDHDVDVRFLEQAMCMSAVRAREEVINNDELSGYRLPPVR